CLPNSQLIRPYRSRTPAGDATGYAAPVSLHRPLALRAPHGSKWIELDWSDAKARRIPTLILRGYCPCAGCQGHGGPVEFQIGRDHDLQDIREVGNYALCFGWADGHDSGIYSFE